MRKHLVAEDRVGDLRCVDKVHLQKSSLQVPLLGLVVFERVEQERCRRLNHILGHKDVDNLDEQRLNDNQELSRACSTTYPLNVHERSSLVINELHRKLGPLLGVRAHDMLQQGSIIRLISNFLRV